MARSQQIPSSQGVLRLFEAGTVAGLDEGELLERFATRRDEAAFAALVVKHGPMVLGICRRRLLDPRDAEDAFQATFLVLIRKAGSIKEPHLLGPWLHGVACRVARRAGKQAARRVGRERTGEMIETTEGRDRPPGEVEELKAAIDEEIRRLPETLRLPIVLCHLEGAHPARGRRPAPDDARRHPRPARPGSRAAPSPAHPPGFRPERSPPGPRTRGRIRLARAPRLARRSLAADGRGRRRAGCLGGDPDRWSDPGHELEQAEDDRGRPDRGGRRGRRRVRRPGAGSGGATVGHRRAAPGRGG